MAGHGDAHVATRIWIAAVFLAAFWAPPAAAQVFELRGGSSSLFDAHGGSVELQGNNYVARLGIGSLKKTLFGFFFGVPYGGFQWGVGDQTIPFVLPTDLFDRSYYFLGRGLGARQEDARSSLFLYGGTTATGFFTPFFNAAETEKPAGVVFYRRSIARSLRFFSHNVFSARQTSIQSFQWDARESLKLALTGGVGDNRYYWAASSDFTRGWVSLLASYGRAADSFRRIRVDTPLGSEPSRENIRLMLLPRENLRFVLGRQNFLCPLPACRERATVNSAGVSANAFGFSLYGSLFDSKNRAGKFKAVFLSGRRRVNGRFDAGLDYLRSAPSASKTTHAVIGTVRETLTPWLSLSQVVTYSGGRTTVACGGNLVSNPLTLGVEYHTLFLPFAQGQQSQFKQALALNLRVQLPWNMSFTGATHVTPLGEVKYLGYANAFLYREPNGGGRGKGALFENIVRGRVTDEAGTPIFGAALRVDGDLVYTDSQGMFFVRRKKARELRLEILLDQFLLGGEYELVSTSPTVRAKREETGEIYQVVLRRRRPAESAPR